MAVGGGKVGEDVGLGVVGGLVGGGVAGRHGVKAMHFSSPDKIWYKGDTKIGEVQFLQKTQAYNESSDQASAKPLDRASIIPSVSSSPSPSSR